MVRKYERCAGAAGAVAGAGVRQAWSEEAMSLAVASVLAGKMGYKMAARIYQIPRSTLQRRASKVRGLVSPSEHSKPTMNNFRRVFTDEQEQDLVGYIRNMESYLMGVTRRDIRELAFQYAVDNSLAHPFDVNTRMAGEDWVRNFLKRNPELTLPGEGDGELERVNFDQFYHFMSRH